MTDNIQIIENNDLNTLNKEILKFTILVTHFETQPCRTVFLFMIFVFLFCKIFELFQMILVLCIQNEFPLNNGIFERMQI